ncbi:hypothetical protein [Paenibacillus sp. FSL R7-0337]|uniref:hypothetical protein n=1 Tax=Paenibacillus sp. FSL R7-0337 TaxID=1926588 RepID=UPI00096F140E|nr:hypothetical protein [Paenibacillus sp. FSL R7-0337]OMF96822.1 hypothetical protein BK147_11670 [Paenibacillus sp. FSL R7-0337]
MIIIQSQEDLAELDYEAFPQMLKRFISDLLEGLQAEAEAEPGEELEHLLSHPLILCEPGDNILALLNAQPMSLEYVEHFDFSGAIAFRAGVLLDNDWLAQYIIPAVVLDEHSLNWLTERCEGGPVHE